MRFTFTSPADPNIAHAGGVVLELEDARLVQAGLRDHQHILVAIHRDTVLLTHLIHLPVVRPVDRGSPALIVTGRPRLRFGLHLDPCFRTCQAGDPGGGLDELPVYVFFWILTQVPDVAVVVLGVEGDLRLHQLVIAVIHNPGDDRAHTLDLFGQVSDGELNAMRNTLTILDRDPLKDPLRPRLQG